MKIKPCDRGLLTRDRVRGYCFIILGVNLIMLALTFAKTSGLTVFGAPFGGDFAQFYSAGRIINEHGSHRLYDLNLQNKLIHDAVPVSADLSIPYVYPPFFALVFSPLARLPFAWAYLVWLAISTALYVGAVMLALQVNPTLPRGLTLLVALAFPPFCMYVLGGGQVSAVGCFTVALALYLSGIGQSFLSGVTLALLLYKPSLVVVIVPTLLFGRQVRIVVGFVLGAAFLFALSWWMIGSEQLIHFGRLLQGLSGPAFEGALPAKYVDLRAFVWLLFHFNLGVIPLFLVLPSAYFFRDRPWITILVTLILNTYAPVHDLVLLVPILIAFGKANRAIVALFLFSLVAESIAQVTRVQILTPLLMYLVWQNRAKK